MKIDLHLHTIKTEDGENNSRNVNPEHFKNQLKRARVGLAAITNHNLFDEKQFEKLREDSLYTLLPGIEIDFFENECKKRSQMNIIFSNKSVDSANNLSNFLKQKNISYKKPIPIDELLDWIKDKKVIIFVDKKSGETKISEECIKYIKNKDRLNNPILYDVNNMRTLRVLMASKANCLIGSDIQSWENDNYVNKDSVDLVESQWQIKNFEPFRSALKGGVPNNEWISKLENIDYDCEIEKDVAKIKILRSGVNVIIGDKATGKTKILTSIRKELESKNSQFAYFSEDTKKDEFDELLKANKQIFNENNDVNEQIKSKINELIKSKLENSHSPLDFSDSVKFPHKSEWKIQDSPLEKNPKTKFDNLDSFLIKTKAIKMDLNNKNEELFITKDASKKFIKTIEKIENFVINNTINSNLNNISSNISDNLKQEIRNLISQLKGLSTNDLSVGLINLYNYKMSMESKILEIKKISLLKKENLFFEDSVPTIGKLKLIDKNVLLPFSNPKTLNKNNKGDHKIKELKNAMKVFDAFSLDSFKEFVKYWEENNDKNVIFTQREIVNDKGIKLDLSSGQKSIFLLARTLNDQKANFFLLDEPSSRIGSNTIMNYVNKKINQIRRARKTIIITTHNSSLGINILPNKYIFRKKDKDEKYRTFWSHIYDDTFKNESGEESGEEDFNEVIMNLLEGGKKSYEIRKEIYESRIKSGKG